MATPKKPSKKLENPAPPAGPLSPWAAAWAIKQKAKLRPTNGNPLRNAQGEEPHAKSESERKPREPEAICGATSKRNGSPCRHPAGLRTDHPGSGRCYLHGGLTPAPKGRYTSVRRPRI